MSSFQWPTGQPQQQWSTYTNLLGIDGPAATFHDLTGFEAAHPPQPNNDFAPNGASNLDFAPVASSSSSSDMAIQDPLSQLMLIAPPTSNNMPSSTSSARPKRMMGVSCDACKLRKVKCDRKDKLQRKRQEHGPDFSLDDIVCTNCSVHSVRCTFTKHTPKPRVGARLRQLKRDANTSAQSAEPDSTSRQSSSDGSSSPRPADVAGKMRCIEGLDAQSTASLASTRIRDPVSAARPPAIEQGDGWSYWDTRVIRNFGLFQVPGLTRPLLDSCLSAYFKWAAPASTPLRGCDFTVGYRAFFDRYQGQPTSDEPVSENLILALAAAGAGVLEDEAPLAGMNKFDLQERLVARFIERLAEQRWAERSDEDSVDLLIACYVLSFWDIEGGEPPQTEQDPFTRRPLSEEFLATLVFKLGLNRAPKLEPRAPRDGPRWRTGRGDRLLDDYEAIRRKRTFLSVFYNDGFRALGARKPLNFSFDCHDHDHSMPRWPRYDGGFVASGPLPPTVSPQGESHPAFESIYLSHAAKLSQLVREASSLFVSARSQTLGVPVGAAGQILQRLCEWLATIPVEVKLDKYLPSDWKRGKAARPTDGYEFFKLIRCLFWEMLYHGAIMGTCSAVQDFGFRPHEGMSEADAKAQEAATMAKFKAATFVSLRRVAVIARRAGTIGILRSHIVVCRNLAAGYALWALDCITDSWKDSPGDEAHRRTYRTGPGCRPSNEELMRMAEEILFGIASVDSSKSTPQTVKALQDNVAKVKAAMAAGAAAESASPMQSLEVDAPIAASIEELFLPPFSEQMPTCAGEAGGDAASLMWQQTQAAQDQEERQKRQQEKKGGRLGGWILSPRGLDALFARSPSASGTAMTETVATRRDADVGEDDPFTFLQPSHPASDVRPATTTTVPPPDLPADLLAMYAPSSPFSSDSASRSTEHTSSHLSSSDTPGTTTGADSIASASASDKFQGRTCCDPHTHFAGFLEQNWSFLSDR